MSLFLYLGHEVTAPHCTAVKPVLNAKGKWKLGDRKESAQRTNCMTWEDWIDTGGRGKTPTLLDR